MRAKRGKRKGAKLKTLRTFQPTIQELKEVSEEFKSTLEDEIGLDEFKSSMQSPPSRPYTSASEEAEANLDEMRRSSAAAAWGGSAEGAGQQQEEAPSAPPPAEAFEETLAAPGSEASDLSKLSVEDLQAELERRKKSQE